jgi:hypothetical protein
VIGSSDRIKSQDTNKLLVVAETIVTEAADGGSVLPSLPSEEGDGDRHMGGEDIRTRRRRKEVDRRGETIVSHQWKEREK